MPAHEDMLIRVLSEWKDWRYAEVRLRDLHGVHWLQPSQAPRPFLHGYTLCTNLVTGEIPHRCDRSGSPHRLLVCILKAHNLPTVFAELGASRRASDPATPPDAHRQDRSAKAGDSEERPQV